jgi:hypothetical protein
VDWKRHLSRCCGGPALNSRILWPSLSKTHAGIVSSSQHDSRLLPWLDVMSLVSNTSFISYQCFIPLQAMCVNAKDRAKMLKAEIRGLIHEKLGMQTFILLSCLPDLAYQLRPQVIKTSL